MKGPQQGLHKIRCCVAHLPDLAEPIRQTCKQGRDEKSALRVQKSRTCPLSYNPKTQDVAFLSKKRLSMPSTCLCSRVVGTHFLLGICPCGLCCDGWAGQDECSSQGSCSLLCEVLLLLQKQQQCSEAAMMVWDRLLNRSDIGVAFLGTCSLLCQSDLSLLISGRHQSCHTSTATEHGKAYLPAGLPVDLCICSKGQQCCSVRAWTAFTLKVAAAKQARHF